ncbi:MAG: universal stress protein [Anaerolineae bacterium]|nr:universal stress protein [Anaerolineae bacterium]
MGKILCATRGGEASIQTQDAAIKKAKETGDELIFIYVFDVEFLAHAKYTLRSDVVTDEMGRMADFLMAMAIDRAKQQGVNARSVIRQGDFKTELVATAKEEQVTLVILGRPAGKDSHFKIERLQDLIGKLEPETGIPFCILPDCPISSS